MLPKCDDIQGQLAMIKSNLSMALTRCWYLTRTWRVLCSFIVLGIPICRIFAHNGPNKNSKTSIWRHTVYGAKGLGPSMLNQLRDFWVWSSLDRVWSPLDGHYWLRWPFFNSFMILFLHWIYRNYLDHVKWITLQWSWKGCSGLMDNASCWQSFDRQFEPSLRAFMATPFWCGLGCRSRTDGIIHLSWFVPLISLQRASYREPNISDIQQNIASMHHTARYALLKKQNCYSDWMFITFPISN